MRLCFLVFMSIFLDFPLIWPVNLNPCSKVHINRLDVNLLITIQQRYHYESPIQYSKYVNAITDIAFCHFLLLIHMVIWFYCITVHVSMVLNQISLTWIFFERQSAINLYISAKLNNTITYLVKWLEPLYTVKRKFLELFGKLEVIHSCAKGIDFASFYDFSIGFWNCSDSVVFCACHFRKD